MLVQKVNDCNFTNAKNDALNQHQPYKLKYRTQYGTIIDTENITILDLASSNTETEIDSHKTIQEQVQDQIQNPNYYSEKDNPNNITHTYSTQNFSLTDIDVQGRFAVFSCDHDLCFAILDMKTGLFFKDCIPSTSNEISTESAFLLDIETDTLHYLHTKITPPKDMNIELHQILMNNHIIQLCEL